MKRGTLVALGILLALTAVYFATTSEPKQVETSPMTVEQVENLDRIEIVPPSEPSDGESGKKDAGADMIAFEKRTDGWWLTRPIEAPAADSVGQTIEEQLGGAIETDDLQIDESRRSKVNLDEGSAARLSLFGDGAETPTTELLVGKQIEIEQTGAIRTFLQRAGDDRMYRAQAELGEFVRKPVDEYRSNDVVNLESDAVTGLEVAPADGPTMTLAKKGEGDKASWQLERPTVDWDLDTSAIDSIVSTLSGLTAEEFADDAEPSDVGLEPPTVRLTAETDDGATELLVGRVDGDSGTEYYVKRADARYIYKVSTYAGEELIAGLGDVRSKTPRRFDKSAISEIRFPSDDDVVVRKQEGNWSLVSPESDKELNQSKLEARLSAIASLRVKEFPEVSDAEAGLTAAADRLVFDTADDQYTILFGDELEGRDGDRYVKFGDGDERYVVSGETARRLFPSVEELVGKGSAGPQKGMPTKGMPRGMPGKGGPGKAAPGGANLSPEQKKKLMQKLKQRKMGN